MFCARDQCRALTGVDSGAAVLGAAVLGAAVRTAVLSFLVREVSILYNELGPAMK